MDFLRKFTVDDNLRIDNSDSIPIDNGYMLHPVTITSQQCYRTLDEFRKQFYEKTKMFTTFACMEYHERSWKIHAHGYVLLSLDESMLVSHRRHQKVPYVFKENGFNFAVENKVSIFGDDQWERYCLKQAQWTLEQNNDTVIGLYNKWYKYGKRRKALE